MKKHKIKIEVEWNVIPNELNQFDNANDFGFRVKGKNFDKTFTNIKIKKNKISDWDAFRYIAYICDFYKKYDIVATRVNTKNMSIFDFFIDRNVENIELKEDKQFISDKDCEK